MPGVAANVPSSLTLIFSGNTRTFAEISAGTTRKGPEPSGAAIKPTALAPGTGEAGRGGRATRSGGSSGDGATGLGPGGTIRAVMPSTSRTSDSTAAADRAARIGRRRAHVTQR